MRAFTGWAGGRSLLTLCWFDRRGEFDEVLSRLGRGRDRASIVGPYGVPGRLSRAALGVFCKPIVEQRCRLWRCRR